MGRQVLHQAAQGETLWMYTRLLQHRIGEHTGEQMDSCTAFNCKDGNTIFATHTTSTVCGIR